MKLIVCLECQDVRKITTFGPTICWCGKSRADLELDGLHATIQGPCKPLGFANSSFARAVTHQQERASCMFTAFVIPKVCETVKRID